jgi:hypothetical protein
LSCSIEALFVLAAIRSFSPGQGWLIASDSGGQISLESRDGSTVQVEVIHRMRGRTWNVQGGHGVVGPLQRFLWDSR